MNGKSVVKNKEVELMWWQLTYLKEKVGEFESFGTDLNLYYNLWILKDDFSIFLKIIWKNSKFYFEKVSKFNFEKASKFDFEKA